MPEVVFWDAGGATRVQPGTTPGSCRGRQAKGDCQAEPGPQIGPSQAGQYERRVILLALGGA